MRRTPLTQELMFYCVPQEAIMSTSHCKKLRKRPSGKAPAGSQPKLAACEKCQMYPLVDKLKVPTVTLKAYLDGAKPKPVSAKLMPAANA